MNFNQQLGLRAQRFNSSVGFILIVLLSATTVWAEARVSQISGEVEIGRGEPPVWERLKANTSIAPNDRIRTGADGRVEIAMDAGTLRVHENSLLRLPPPVGDADQVQLDQGHSLFDVLRRAGRRFEVHTPTVVVSVKGTRFSVDASNELGEVAVYRGMVGVREAGEFDAMTETLVREGFLATGGPGATIELDVAPSGDPWASWQDFGRSHRGTPAAPKRMSEVDRAKASLLRQTEGDVLRRAAERKPEVAERLRQAKKRSARAGDANKAFPAAAAPRGDEPNPGTSRGQKRDSMGIQPNAEEIRNESREMLRERRNGIRQGEIAEKEISADAGLSYDGSGDGRSIDDIFDWSAFENGSPGLLMRIAMAREDVEQQYQAAGGGWTTDDIQNALINSLVNDGMDTAAAADLVNNFLGQ